MNLGITFLFFIENLKLIGCFPDIEGRFDNINHFLLEIKIGLDYSNIFKTKIYFEKLS